MKATQTKIEQHRSGIRERQIQEYKKIVRFKNMFSTMKKNAKNEAEHSETSTQAESNQGEKHATFIVEELVDKQNIQKFIEVFSSYEESAQLMIAIGQRKQQILQLILNKIHTPEGILLLGNLIDYGFQLVKDIYERKIITKVVMNMQSYRQNLQIVEFYAWALCQLTEKLQVLMQNELQQVLQPIYEMSQRYCNSSYLIRLISHISYAITLPHKLIKLLCQLKPEKQIVKVSTFISLTNYINKANDIQQKQCLMLIDYFCDQYDALPHQIKYERKPFFYYINQIVTKVQQSQGTCLRVLDNKKLEIKKYLYGNKFYYELLLTMFKSMPLDAQVLETLQQAQMFANVVSDMTDPHKQISYYCVKIVQVLLISSQTYEKTKLLLYLKNLGLQENLEELRYNFMYQNQKVMQVAETILQMMQ